MLPIAPWCRTPYQKPVKSSGVSPRLLLFVLALAAGFPSPSRADRELCDGRDNDADSSIDENCPGVCADPRASGAEILLTDATAFAQLGRDTGLVWDGRRLAAVWVEQAGIDFRVFFRRADAAGRPLGTATPLYIGPASSDPAIAWTGSGYGVVWTDEDFGLPQVLFAHLDESGVVTAGPTQINTVNEDGTRPAIAWDGSAFVISWAWYNSRIHMRRVTPSGTKLGTESCISCTVAQTGAQEVSLAIAPGKIGYAFSDGRGALLFAQSDSSGGLQGSIATITTATGADFPSLVWTGSEWGVVWFDRRLTSEGIYFNRLSTTPAKLLATDQRINGNEANSSQPVLAWTGSEYVTAWIGGNTQPYAVLLRRISVTGTPLGTTRSYGIGQYSRGHTALVWNGSRPVVLRDEDEFAPRSPIKLRMIDCCEDADADGVSWCDGDRDDREPLVFPGGPESCDGRDNDQDGTLDEGCDRQCDLAVSSAQSVGHYGQGASEIALAVQGGSSGTGWIVHHDTDAGGVQLRVDDVARTRGGLLETDLASSDQPTAVWAGDRVVSLFRDQRSGSTALRSAARSGNGAALFLDEPLGFGDATLSSPSLAWTGRRLLLAFQRGNPAHLFTTVLSENAAALQRESQRDSATAAGTLAHALTRDPRGGGALLWLEPRPSGEAVMFARLDDDATIVSGPTEVAAPVSGRSTPSLVATDIGFLAAWVGPEAAGGARDLVIRPLDMQGVPTAAVQTLGSSAGQPQQPRLSFTGQEIVLIYRAAVSGDERLRRIRLSTSGARLGPDVPFTPRGAQLAHAGWDGSGVRVAFRQGGSGSNALTGTIAAYRIDCAVSRAAPIDGLRFTSKTAISWNANIEGSNSYDVLSGKLDGRFNAGSIDACEANDISATTLTLPERPRPRFYTVRAAVGGTAGSYDDPGAGQVGSLDPTAATDPDACP